MALESSETAAGDVFEFEQFRADLRARTLLRDGQAVAITSKVFDTLAFLVRRHGEVVDKDQLLKAIWPDAVVEESNLHHYVSTLRKVLGEKSGENRFIATVPGRGYSFVAPMRVVTPESQVEWRIPRRLLALGACLVAAVVLLGLASRSVNRLSPKKRLARHLTASLGVAEMAAFSPDGREVVFSWRAENEEHSHLYIRATGSEQMRQITFGPAFYRYPAWSPDGLQIAFIRYSVAGDVTDYYLMPAQGGAITVVAAAKMLATNTPKIAWNRDGKNLIIEGKGTSDQPSRLSLLSVDGKQQRFLTFAVGPPGDIAPAVSPDGKLLAFLHWAPPRIELRVMPATGGESRALGVGDSEVGPTGIAWTPDGRAIVYHSARGGLWKTPLRGGESERLGIGKDNAVYPAISASGHLAFTEPESQVTLINATLPGVGLAPVAVQELLPSTQSVFDPQRSPDGGQIVFSSNRSGSIEIWRSDSAAGSLAQLTSFGGPPTVAPRWSPDGKWIAFDSQPAGNMDIYVISASGSSPRRLTTEPSMDRNPAWSNTGDTIYFSSNRSGTEQVWKMLAAGGPASQVTTDGGIFPAVSADGYLYFLKGGTTSTLWRMPLEGGHAEVVLDGGLRAPRLWSATGEGVYYIDRATALRYFDVRSRRHSDPLLQFPRSEILVTTTIGASRDGRSVLIPRFRQSGTDVLLAEKFW